MEIHIREKCADCLDKGFLKDGNSPTGSRLCPSCNGKGIREQWVSIKEFLALLSAEHSQKL